MWLRHPASQHPAVAPYTGVWIATPRGRWRPPNLSRRTLHGCVDSNLLSLPLKQTSKVAPYTGVWIATVRTLLTVQSTKVAPCAGARIATPRRVQLHTLKWLSLYARARITIRWAFPHSPAAPHTDERMVWLRHSVSQHLAVAPYAGAWITSEIVQLCLPRIKSHPARVCG